jgi:ABC-type Mn2+/Zn2+ transport system ATPase subunit
MTVVKEIITTVDKPDVLLFDEPTSGVDLDSEEAIYGMLKTLTAKNKITLLLISHDLHIVREYSDYALAINRCIVFFGESKIQNKTQQATEKPNYEVK